MNPATAITLAVAIPTLAWAWKRHGLNAGAGAPGLTLGQTYRLRVLASPAYTDAISRAAAPGQEQVTLEKQIGIDVAAAGFQPPSAVIEDPSVHATPSLLFTVIARAARAAMGSTRPEISIVGAEPVDAALAESMSRPASPDATGLDDGLSTAEAHAVGFALMNDADPRRLEGFAETFDGDYPLAASVLHAKARLETLARQTATVSGPRPHPDRARSVGALRRRGFPVRDLAPPPRGYHPGGIPGMPSESARVLGALSHASRGFSRARVGGLLSFIPVVGPALDVVVTWMAAHPGETEAAAAAATTDPVQQATADAAHTVSDLWERYGGVVETLGGAVPGPQLWLLETAVKEAEAVESEASLLSPLSKQALRFVGGLRQSAPWLAYVPGLGQGVAVMLTAAAVLATCGLGGGCEPLDQAAIDFVASQIPGGPVTQTAFKDAVMAGYGVARGEAWDQIATEVLRADLPSDEARVAFDAGLALARGELLTRSGFQKMYQLARGSGLADKALDFAGAIADAATKNIPVKTSLLNGLADSLASWNLTTLDVRITLPKALSAIQLDPSLLQMWPADLSAALDVPEPIANIALGAFQDIGSGVVLADPDVTRRFMPFADVRASSAALLVASSQFAPERAGITDPYALQSLINSWSADNADNPTFQSAKEKAAVEDAMARARRTLDRQNWVSWYAKIEALDMMG